MRLNWQWTAIICTAMACLAWAFGRPSAPQIEVLRYSRNGVTVEAVYRIDPQTGTAHRLADSVPESAEWK